jgi:hypothetical protein
LPLGTEVWLPATFVVVSNPASQPIPQGQISATEQALGRGEPDYNSTAATEAAGETSAGGKARLRGPRASMRQLRTNLEARKTAPMKSAVAAFLADQRREIAALVRDHADAIVARKGRDASPWWPAKKAAEWDQRLGAALAGHLGGVAEAVHGHVLEVLPATGKAKVPAPTAKAEASWQMPAITVNVPEQPAPVVNLPAPIVNVAATVVPAPIVNVAAPIVQVPPLDMDPFVTALREGFAGMARRPTRKTVKRDQLGRITEVTEE